MGKWDISALEKLKQAQEAKKTLKRPRKQAKPITQPKKKKTIFEFTPNGYFEAVWGRGVNTFIEPIEQDYPDEPEKDPVDEWVEKWKKDNEL